MNNRNNVLSAISYITWIGFLIAFFMGDRTDRFLVHHLNQSFMLNIVSIAGAVLTVIPLIGSTAAWIITTLAGVYQILGILRGATGRENPIPFIGEIHIIG